MKVLIADDSALVSERLIKMISELEDINIIGHAKNTPETIKIINEFTPDVVILDIRMPGGSGFDVLNKINKKIPSIHVIVLTNFPYPQYEEKCKELGADFFLDKSSEFDKIPDVLKQLLENSSNKFRMNTD